MAKGRICNICKTPLPGKKGHGFVVDGGRSVICGDYRRHNRIKQGRKFSYGYEEASAEASEAEA